MGQTWEETQPLLESLRREYLIITQELQATSDPQRQVQLREWASICRREFCYALDQYKKQQLDQNHTTQDSNQ